MRRPASRTSCKRGHQRGLERFLQFLLVVRIVALQAFHARLNFRLQLGGLRRNLGVGEFAHLRLERVDFRDQGLQLFNVAFVLRADEARDDAIYEFFNIHIFRFGRTRAHKRGKIVI